MLNNFKIDVLDISTTVEFHEDGIGTRFKIGINPRIGDNLPDDKSELLQNHLKEIAEIINDVIVADCIDELTDMILNDEDDDTSDEDFPFEEFML